MNWAPPYRRPNRDPDLGARIVYLAPEAGGRRSVAFTGYRPMHDFGIPGELNDAQHEYPDVETVPVGQPARALLWLLGPDRQTGRLHAGFEFTVQEGARTVGRGVVTRVLDPALATKQHQ